MVKLGLIVSALGTNDPLLTTTHDEGHCHRNGSGTLQTAGHVLNERPGGGESSRGKPGRRRCIQQEGECHSYKDEKRCLAPAMQLALPVFADGPPLPLEHTPQSEVQTATQLPGQQATRQMPTATRRPYPFRPGAHAVLPKGDLRSTARCLVGVARERGPDDCLVKRVRIVCAYGARQNDASERNEHHPDAYLSAFH